MMKFSVTPAPAKEDLEPGAIDPNWKDPLSAGAHMQVYGEIMISICDSIARALNKTGIDKASLTEKMMDLINLFKKNGDMDESLAKYLVEHEFSNFEYEVRSNLDKVEKDPWDSWWIIFKGARSGIGCGAQWSEDYGKKMNDREKELVNKLYDARNAYWKAQDEYDNYVFDHAVMTINDIFVKYGETFAKINSEWFAYTEDQLKYWVAQVEKRRAEKKAEDDTTADRPAPAV